ncbi:unnamed protein product [Nezara viridula]|uniref:Uncharacterized protein n=1 Tax=Nezara viridula TaxID=85310 RepID=A0A9P0MJA9_NEZVI|nr:unnamed protein product [Nezara viridula]
MFPHDEVITIKYKHGYLRPILKKNPKNPHPLPPPACG